MTLCRQYANPISKKSNYVNNNFDFVLIKLNFKLLLCMFRMVFVSQDWCNNNVINNKLAKIEWAKFYCLILCKSGSGVNNRWSSGDFKNHLKCRPHGPLWKTVKVNNALAI